MYALGVGLFSTGTSFWEDVPGAWGARLRFPIYCDSKSAIAITANPVQHSKTKHIYVRYHFIKDHVEKGTIEMYFVQTDYQLAGLFTKPLDEKRFNFLVSKLGMLNFSV